MNRIVLIGNGFDLAHGLKTSYADFINWYWEQLMNKVLSYTKLVFDDKLCRVILSSNYSAFHSYFDYYAKPDKSLNGYDFLLHLKNDHGLEVYISPLLEAIMENYQKKKWVDIECEYYKLLCNLSQQKSDYTPVQLNQHLNELKKKMHEYLTSVVKQQDVSLIDEVKNKMFEPIYCEDISTQASKHWEIFHGNKISYNAKARYKDLIKDYFGKNIPNECNDILKIDQLRPNTTLPPIFYLPDNILVISFNYTDTIDKYIQSLPSSQRFKVNHIHGDLQNLDEMIFGYGNEDDKFYKTLLNSPSEFTTQLKFIRYSYDERYREISEFLNQDTFQVYIMGHSCGESDHSLLNRLFEHKNCVSIKPFYHKMDSGDNAHELITAIHRSFTTKKRALEYVVNKKRCRYLIDKTKRETLSALDYYIDAFKNMNIPIVRRDKAPYKPLLMLAIIDMIGAVNWEDLQENQIEGLIIPFKFQLESYLEFHLENCFNLEWEKQKYYDLHFNKNYTNVLFYMEDEPFYRLSLLPDKQRNNSRDLQDIKETYQGIKLDPELMKLLINPETRQQLRTTLEEMLSVQA